MFLDFYKAFDTIEHEFLLQSLKAFGFGNNFVDIVSMFYKDINSSIIINLNTSRFVYPSLSLFVNDSIATEVNRIFFDFIWKNKSHKLKKSVLSNSKVDGGLEVLDFVDTVNTFKINWLKKCLKNPDSIWYFIPYYIFLTKLEVFLFF